MQMRHSQHLFKLPTWEAASHDTRRAMPLLCRVHYSTMNAERCEIRHKLEKEAVEYQN